MVQNEDDVETKDFHAEVKNFFSLGSGWLKAAQECSAFRKCSSHNGFYISHRDNYLSLPLKAHVILN